MTTDKKLIIALFVLIVLGGAVWMQKQKADEVAAAHTLEGAESAFPEIALDDEQIKGIDKVEISKPKDDDSPAVTHVLVKKGEEDWALEKPTSAKANASNVKSLLDNTKRLEINEQIDSTKAAYEKFEVTDDKAVHAVFYKGKEKLLDVYFGQDGSRGQMTRIAGKDGVFAVKGFSRFLYERDTKDWRDKTIFKFEDKDAKSVTVENENGVFSFEKDGDEWNAKQGKKKGAGKHIEEFDKSKIESLLRAYKSLNATDFGDDKSPADVGLDEPTATVTIEMTGGSATYVLSVGDTAEGSNRWVKKNGSDQIFSISSWAGDWATAETEKFQKGGDDAPPPGGPGGAPTGLPPGMGMPPGAMPPGHP